MTQASPRSLQLLHDIISDSEDQTSLRAADAKSRVENMNGEVRENFNEVLNFFEKLEQENKPAGLNGQVKVNGFMNDHVENGVTEDSLQGIAEESGDDTLTEEVSETTVDTTSSYVTSKKNRYSRRSNNHRRDQNHNHKPGKTSSVRDNSTDRDSMSDFRETMSDSGRVGRRQRKLKRAQYREFRPIGLEPLETAEERLEKKYKELEKLISGQFVEQKKALSMNHLQQMELLRQQYAIASHGLPPSGVLIPRSLPSHHRANRRDKENHGHPASEDEAYTTIRTLQASRVSQRRSRARSARTRPLSATRHNQSRSTSRDGRDRSEKNENHSSRTKARSRSNSGSRSSSRSPRRVATETHLKNTENDFVREWIKKKDKEYRQQKVEERRRKKQERKQKIEKQIEREERFKDSHLVVQAWMKQKQKEAYRKQRQERHELRQEVKEKEQQRSQNVSGIHGWGVDRPLSAPSPVRTDRNKIRVQRPGTTASEVREERKLKQSSVENGDAVQQEIPQPPMTKFIYRRPVLGKVRLRNKSPHQEAAKSAPAKKPAEKPLSKEEIEKKQRMSYDDWLQQKRKEDLEKKKELQRKKELAKSNPEYEVPVPELVQNSDNNVLRGKHISGSSGRSGPRPAYVSKIISQEERDRIREMAREKKRQNRTLEEEVNTSYDERSESPEDAIERVAKNVVSYVLKSLSDNESEDDLFEDTDEIEHEGLSNLSIHGSRATLSSKTRPMSASARIPGPQPSRSPRRPVSAQPKQRETAQTSFEGCIPFPDDIGAPPQVLKVQQKLFAERMSDNSEEEQQRGDQPDSLKSMEEVQESNTEHPTVQVVEQLDKQETPEEEILEEMLEVKLETTVTKEEKWISESLDYGEVQENSKKHVSFCEETTIFDEVESDDFEEEEWNEVAGEGDFDMEKIRKMIVQSKEEEGEAINQEKEVQEHQENVQEDVQEKVQTELQEQQEELEEEIQEEEEEFQAEFKEQHVELQENVQEEQKGVQQNLQEEQEEEGGQEQSEEVEEDIQEQQEEVQEECQEEEQCQGEEQNEDEEEDNSEDPQDMSKDATAEEEIPDDQEQQNEIVEGDIGTGKGESDNVFLTSGTEDGQLAQTSV